MFISFWRTTRIGWFVIFRVRWFSIIIVWRWWTGRWSMSMIMFWIISIVISRRFLIFWRWDGVSCWFICIHCWWSRWVRWRWTKTLSIRWIMITMRRSLKLEKKYTIWYPKEYEIYLDRRSDGLPWCSAGGLLLFGRDCCCSFDSKDGGLSEVNDVSLLLITGYVVLLKYD